MTGGPDHSESTFAEHALELVAADDVAGDEALPSGGRWARAAFTRDCARKRGIYRRAPVPGVDGHESDEASDLLAARGALVEVPRVVRARIGREVALHERGERVLVRATHGWEVSANRL